MLNVYSLRYVNLHFSYTITYLRHSFYDKIHTLDDDDRVFPKNIEVVFKWLIMVQLFSFWEGSPIFIDFTNLKSSHLLHCKKFSWKAWYGSFFIAHENQLLIYHSIGIWLFYSNTTALRPRRRCSGGDRFFGHPKELYASYFSCSIDSLILFLFLY